MLHHYPDFYHTFHCLAAACPDSCCYGWEVVVDPDSAARFQALEGSLGQELRQAMVTDEDGDRIFRLQDGRCPFWNSQGLCRIELELGHEAPCETCRKFPRLTQDYGTFVDHGLTLACPEAARLILTHKGPWKLETLEDGQPPEDMDPQWLACVEELGTLRQELLTLLWRQDLSQEEGLSLTLDRAQWHDTRLQGLSPGPWDSRQVLARLRAPALPQPSIVRELLSMHRGLELLTQRWGAILDRALACPDGLLAAASQQSAVSMPEDWGRNLMTDCLYRYFLQAADHGDCVTDLMLTALMWYLVRILTVTERSYSDACPPEETLPQTALRLFSLYAKEVSHDPVNRETLTELLLDRPWFSIRGLQGLLCCSPEP